MSDFFNLQRFVNAQNPVFDAVLSELRAGDKTGHWMWFIFPQLKGLGTSANAQYFGLVSLAEAEAYLQHPILGQRLRECTTIVNLVEGRSADAIFGGIDAVKFRSSMTLFGEASQPGGIFAEALAKYFGGAPDRLTLEKLRKPVVPGR